MKYLLTAIFSFFLICPAFAVQKTTDSNTGSECQNMALNPRQKWVIAPLGPVDRHGQPYTITLLLLPEQLCDTAERSEEERALCHEHWKLIPYEQSPLRNDEIQILFGSVCARITEESLCILARGIHQISSSGTVVDTACHRLWQKKYLEQWNKR